MSLATSATPMSTESLGPQAHSRTKAAKAKNRPAADKAKKVSFYLSPEAIKRLGVTAAMEARDRSSLVEELIRGMKLYDLPRRRTAPGAAVEHGEDRQADEAA